MMEVGFRRIDADVASDQLKSLEPAEIFIGTTRQDGQNHTVAGSLKGVWICSGSPRNLVDTILACLEEAASSFDQPMTAIPLGDKRQREKLEGIISEQRIELKSSDMSATAAKGLIVELYHLAVEKDEDPASEVILEDEKVSEDDGIQEVEPDQSDDECQAVEGSHAECLGSGPEMEEAEVEAEPASVMAEKAESFQEKEDRFALRFLFCTAFPGTLTWMVAVLLMLMMICG